jgi:hypothetical protein
MALCSVECRERFAFAVNVRAYISDQCHVYCRRNSYMFRTRFVNLSYNQEHLAMEVS